MRSFRPHSPAGSPLRGTRRSTSPTSGAGRVRRRDLGHAWATSAAVTEDEDLAQRKVLSRHTGPVLVWIRLPNTRGRDLLAWFGTVLPDIVAAMDKGETMIEVT